ncbi:hypothetical protein [Methylobacter sp. sgz302048]|uniref:hypothetical protein n=1 Tax=Methylobacter sp. sgz302048 TaxID=3455945 RepID=UPI003FA0D285
MKRLETDLLKAELHQPIDLLMGCISYESRCLSIPTALENSDIQYLSYFKVREFSKASSNNEDKLKVLFNDKLTISEYSNHNPIEFSNFCIDQLDRVYADIGRPLNIVLDISTFTRDALIMVIGMLFYKQEYIDQLSLIYMPASKMSNEWLSRGFRNVRSVLGFPGKRSSLKPLHVVIMTGFELDRAKYIIDEYEPDLISIGVGKCEESINPEFYERNQKFVNVLSNFYASRINNFCFSLIDPIKVATELAEYLSQFKEYNTVIAPLNNKVSTVGAALYGLKHEESQICYLPVEEYNTKNYSEPDNVVYFDKINLTSI